MRFRNSDIFNSNNIKTSFHQQNSSVSSPYVSRHPKGCKQSDLVRISTFKLGKCFQKQKVYFRSNLTIQYTPKFSIVSENNQTITIKINEYTLELLPWLIKKGALFKVNIVLGIYIAFLQLIDLYGLFPIHPNMMRVNQKQQVAVWINKNFQAFQPDQVVAKTSFSMKQFIKSFLRIFLCCLPYKKMSENYNEPKDLLNQLARLKRKQQIHKNCHQFIKHDNKISTSRKSNKCHSNLYVQSQKQIPQSQRYSTKPVVRLSDSPNKINQRLSSLSPVKYTQRSTSLHKNFSRTSAFLCYKKPSFVPYLFKKNSERMLTELERSRKQNSISTSGQLYKRYLMYNTSKFQKMSKTVHQYQYIDDQDKGFSQKGPIFRSQVHHLNENLFSQTILQEPSPFQFMSQQKLQKVQNNPVFSRIKFRKMSSNTNEKNIQLQSRKRIANSGNWFINQKQSNNQKQGNNYVFGGRQIDQNPKNENKQKFKNSFPYKTSSTLTSFRLSNQNQFNIYPSKSQQNLKNCIVSSSIPLCMKQKDRKIQQMKIQEQNELQCDFNNIFSMQNSNLKKQQQQKRLQKIISQFQQLLF